MTHLRVSSSTILSDGQRQFMCDGTFGGVLRFKMNPSNDLDDNLDVFNKLVEDIVNCDEEVSETYKVIILLNFMPDSYREVKNIFFCAYLIATPTIAPPQPDNSVGLKIPCLTGADVSQVSYAVGTDSRIGPKFLNASVGFGGSCFQKDILNLVYICECNGLPEVAEYWKQVIKINDYQKTRFVNRVVASMFNTVANKKVAILGFAFKKDTGDTRETPAIDVCKGLLGDKARLSIYDPQVTEDQIQRDLTMNKFDWDHPLHLQPMSPSTVKQVSVVWDAYEATKDAHAVCILTEWDEFKSLDFQRIYENMQKPAFIFDGRNVVNAGQLREIGFIVYSIGKPLDAWLKDMPAVA
ncbi:UDP-glucose 6-dehydrogenase 3-like [Olea europaea var. sylvestris]|uniref:UDP-glucose 6-dehydrogenase 3-like n=1 Tax=Olea europaea var. sylvestris TaxID=158386 RepID=UPI000C1CE5A7|nr:UDP-glucose 6-dehydrogenase 3-like [Olea europaea var. sylvestris]